MYSKNKQNGYGYQSPYAYTITHIINNNNFVVIASTLFQFFFVYGLTNALCFTTLKTNLDEKVN